MKNPLPQIKITCLLATVTLAATAFAVDPPPDGGYALSNTAEGEDALFSLTTGPFNTGIGFNALYHNTAGDGNTATGFDALWNNTIGHFNTAQGAIALYSNTTGEQNTAIGVNALWSNTTGSKNTAIGNNALYFHTIGKQNTAIGINAMEGVYPFPVTGSSNTANGSGALLKISTGSSNIALGADAGKNLTTGNYNIDIGHIGFAGDTNTIRIGDQRTHTGTFIAGISGTTVPAGVGVIVDTYGHLGTVVSSRRFKDNVQPMDKASEAILALKPVTFRYKHELDPDGIRQFGLVAEQVEKVNPDLVARDEKGKPYTVRYEAVNAMLLNEFLKEHRKGEQQDSKIEQLEATVASLQSELKAQAAHVQKVSDQLAASQITPPMLVNSR